MSSISSAWTFVLFVVYVCTSCFGLYLLKAAETWKSIQFASGFLLYASGAVMWMAILRLMSLSVAFPIAAGSLMIGTMLTGALMLNEAVALPQILGAVLIVLGIALIAVYR